jgi:hypothetical protein
MFSLSGTFIANFKLADNIRYNFSILRVLYLNQSKANIPDKAYFEKPITVILVSICEALVCDFIFRSQKLTREGVFGLSNLNLAELRKSKAWDLEKKVKLVKRLDLLQTKNKEVYEVFSKLAKLRNRLHIQNEKANFEADEIKAYTNQRRVIAEKLLEYMICRFGELYPRPAHIHLSKYVDDFEMPWDSHHQTTKDSDFSGLIKAFI